MSFRFPPKPPPKKSLFERQRAEAEAKRQREAAETAAVYEEFVKSFDDGGGGEDKGSRRSAQPAAQQQQRPPPLPISGAPVGSAGGRRHFSMRSSLGGGGFGGPGSSVGTQKKKRPFPFEARAFGDDDEDQGGDMAVDDVAMNDNDDNDIYNDNDDDDDHEHNDHVTAVARPTIRLANLPPRTSPAAVRALVASGNARLTVDRVRMLPTAGGGGGGGGGTDRKAAAALVLLAANTAASEIDAAVSALQNRYLGFGHYLTLHRHLSSAVVGSAGGGGGGGVGVLATVGGSGSSGGASSQPFGARPVPQEKTGAGRGGGGFAPPPAVLGGRGGGRGITIPPPSSLYGSGGGSGAAAASLSATTPLLHVPVHPPRNIRQLRMIHKVVERVLAHGPAFEALLMSRPAVQTDEKWAWLWDARSEGGVWYRYRLWAVVTGAAAAAGSEAGDPKYVPLFEGTSAWRTPDRHALPYEFATDVADLASDSAYDEEEEDDEDNDDGLQPKDGDMGDDDRFLGPLDKARLTHLLARLPTALSRARRGDLARVTAFALAHARRGADEVVDMVVANVVRPLAVKREKAEKADKADKTEKAEKDDTPPDTTGAQLVAVYVVSDILAASATGGVRHAWRYRQLFETALGRRAVFAVLGRRPLQLRWGRLRADKWQRSIRLVLDQWEAWSVFGAETHAALVASFMRAGEAPPEEEEGAAAETAAAPAPLKSRWKTVDATATATETTVPAAVTEGDTAADDDADDAWAYRSAYTDDEDLDLACLDAEDIDGVPMDVAPGDAYRAYLDGEPLTEEALAQMGYVFRKKAAAAAAAEVSEEGEIQSGDDGEEEDDDDDDDNDDGLSSASEGRRGRSPGRERSRERSRSRDRNRVSPPPPQPRSDVDMADAPDAVRSRPKRLRAADLFAEDEEA